MYGDYQLVLEAVVDALAGVRDAYAATLDEAAAAEYEDVFAKSVRKRFSNLPEGL
jgi:hypothetical protein